MVQYRRKNSRIFSKLLNKKMNNFGMKSLSKLILKDMEKYLLMNLKLLWIKLLRKNLRINIFRRQIPLIIKKMKNKKTISKLKKCFLNHNKDIEYAF